MPAADPTAAIEHYAIAADNGHLDAQLELAASYKKGAAKDDANAFKYYHMAAEQESGYAQLRVGLAYYEGKGVERNVRFGHAAHTFPPNMRARVRACVFVRVVFL